jgi:hypothetical protein
MVSILPQLFLVIEILEIDFSIINIKFYVLLSVLFAEKCDFLKNRNLEKVHHFKWPVINIIRCIV